VGINDSLILAFIESANAGVGCTKNAIWASYGHWGGEKHTWLQQKDGYMRLKQVVLTGQFYLEQRYVESGKTPGHHA
jgi:hypothetical protein